MMPTNELRWVERTETTVVEVHDDYTIGSKVIKQVLQQKWIDEGRVLSVSIFQNGLPIKTHPHEWRDVPTVKDGT
jgi:hypothetical protein